MNRWVITTLAAAGVVISSAHADNLWERRDPRYAYLFQDNRARQVGDIVTVVVSESTVNNEKDQRDLSKSNSMSGTGAFTGASSGGGGTGPGTARNGSVNFSMSDSFNRTFNGSAQLTTNRVFTDRMAATVVDVMPNGNLVLEGYRSRIVQGEERVLRFTGVVRQQDVGVGNLVPSPSVANFKVSYLGRGTETRFVNQNYLGRAINRLWPW